MTIAGFGDGKVFPPKGVLGGKSGGPSLGYALDEQGDRIQELPLIGLFEVKEGHCLEAFTTGGGGFGEPINRDPERVRADVRRGWVTPEQAYDVFGVVLQFETELFTVDYQATNKTRSRISGT